MRSQSEGRRVHLIASLGGHLELLQALGTAFEDHERTWITSPGSRADALAGDGERVITIPRLDRSSLSPGSLFAGVRLALRERPRVVVTSGAGLTVPFAVVSTLLGARLVFIETMARVSSGSVSGRLLSRIGAKVFVQWPELADIYPKATLCQPLLLIGPGSEASQRRGTFVTVGSHDAPFDRLLDAVAEAARAGVLPEPVFLQVGVARRTDLPGESVAFLSPREFGDRVTSAEVVVSHGGAGAIATAVRAGRRPLVMGRSAALGEHVDDHQDQLIGKLAEIGAVVTIADAITPDLLERATQVTGLADQFADLPSLLDVVEPATRR